MANYMQDAFNVAAILVLVAIVVGRIRALVRTPRSAVARVTLLLWATAIAVNIVGNINVYAAIDTASGIPHLAQLIMDCLGLTAAWAIQMWVLHWTYPSDVADARARRRLYLLLGAITLLCLCFFAAPINREAPLFLEAYAHTPWMRPYYLIFLVAFGYTMAELGYMSLRYARLVHEPILRIGLRLIAAGSAFGLLFVINKALFALGDLAGITPDWSNQVANRIVQAGMFYCTLIGATCSTWAPRCVRWLGLYRRYRRVYPLWRDLHSAFPRTALDPQPPPLTLVLRGRAFDSAQLHYRITRLVIEINDCRLQLRRYLSQATIDAAQSRAAATGVTGLELLATVDATLIAVTLAEHWAGRPAAEEHPGLPSPGHADLDAEIDYVTLVATAYRRVSGSDTGAHSAPGALHTPEVDGTERLQTR